MKGLEPSTPGATVQCSTFELHSPSRRSFLLYARGVTSFSRRSPAGCRVACAATVAELSNAPGGNRTPDLRLRRPLLYPTELLALAICDCGVGVRGFEPPTTYAQGRCATRLRYTPRLEGSPGSIGTVSLQCKATSHAAFLCVGERVVRNVRTTREWRNWQTHQT